MGPPKLCTCLGIGGWAHSRTADLVKVALVVIGIIYIGGTNALFLYNNSYYFPAIGLLDATQCTPADVGTGICSWNTTSADGAFFGGVAVSYIVPEWYKEQLRNGSLGYVKGTLMFNGPAVSGCFIGPKEEGAARGSRYSGCGNTPDKMRRNWKGYYNGSSIDAYRYSFNSTTPVTFYILDQTKLEEAGIPLMSINGRPLHGIYMEPKFEHVDKSKIYPFGVANFRLMILITFCVGTPIVVTLTAYEIASVELKEHWHIDEKSLKHHLGWYMFELFEHVCVPLAMAFAVFVLAPVQRWYYNDACMYTISNEIALHLQDWGLLCNIFFGSVFAFLMLELYDRCCGEEEDNEKEWECGFCCMLHSFIFFLFFMSLTTICATGFAMQTLDAAAPGKSKPSTWLATAYTAMAYWKQGDDFECFGLWREKVEGDKYKPKSWFDLGSAIKDEANGEGAGATEMADGKNFGKEVEAEGGHQVL